MEKVSLRVYNREIEGLIDQGATSEAIAHCRHILTTFPKHLETYRLLGKSYLESRRYDEAVDIFSRVLMSVPDDFVSHVGMSIIRDEENKLDDAIWHMERAFESQPSNPAIQGELQRLYGRRDGMEPPKVRMTRGALAHMYIQGELYPQAIAEIRAVLSQDAQRADMQILLARAFFKSGQKADASDICRQLLGQYPYCLDANRIMLDLVPAKNGGSDSSEMYRTRVSELDPYAAFAKGSAFQSSEVTDTAVNLEKFEYSGEEVPAGGEWNSSLGIGLASSSSPPLAATTSDNQPEWLKDYASVQSEPLVTDEDASTVVSKSPEEIPEFLREAGWGESSGAPEQPSAFDDSMGSGGDEALTPADVPDWLKGQIPAESVQPFGTIQAGTEETLSSETPDWLAGLNSTEGEQPAAPATSSSADIPDWLGGIGGAELSESAPGQTEEFPDWLGGPADAQPATADSVQKADASDWMAGTGAEPPADTGSVQTDDTPDWLSDLGSARPAQDEPIQSAGTPDWLQGPAADQPPESLDSIRQVAEIFDDHTPQGGSADELLKPADRPLESLGTTGEEQDDAMAWLESLAAKHGAKPEELVTDPSKRTETPPAWVEQARASTGGPSAVPTEASFSEKGLGAISDEQDDSLAWLESLAAKQGGRTEEFTPAPAEGSDAQQLDWFQQESSTAQEPPVTQQDLRELGSSAQEQDDAVAWLESLAAKHGAKPEELLSDPGKRSETPPEWVQQASILKESQPPAISRDPVDVGQGMDSAWNLGDQLPAGFKESTPVGEDETGMWLKQKKESEAQDQEISPAGDLPDWIMDTKESSESSDKDQPGWLDTSRDEPAGQEKVPDIQHVSGGDLSDWLTSLDEEPAVTPGPPSNDQELPGWLTRADSEGQIEKPDWLKLPEKGMPATPVPTDEPASEITEADLPAWLQGVDDKSGAAAMDEEIAPWMKTEDEPAEEKITPKPTSPMDWKPVDRESPSTVRFPDLASRPPLPKPKPSTQPPQEPTYSPIEDELSDPSLSETRKPVAPPLETRKPVQPSLQPAGPSAPRAEARAAAQASAPLPEQPEKAAPAKKSGARSGGTRPAPSALNQAKDELDRGDIPAALEHYGKLIKKGKHLEETIRDLNESIYRYPVEVGIWQTLGDAYMRSNRLKEALEAYNKAEELIR